MSAFRSTTYDDRRDDRRDDADDVRAPGWEDAVRAAAPGALVAAEAPLAPDGVTGNLRRYARWQWRDFWQRRGFWLAGAALFGVWLMVRLVTMARSDGDPMSPEQMRVAAAGMFTLGGGLAGLLGVGGLVARERERGLQRFLFAKPVGIVRYYLQAYAINGVGSLLVVLGAVLLAALLLAPAVSVATVFALAAAAYVLTSGITFFVSTLVRFDAPIAGAWVLAGFPLVAAAESGRWWAQALQWLFPQGPAFAMAKAMNPRDPESALGVALLAALIAAAYGALCVAGAVVVLRRRSVST